MEMKTTTVKGLAFDVIVVETVHRDARGILFYVAAIFIREHKTGARRLVRRTRVPGTGQEVARAVQQHGVRALDKLTA